MNEQDGRWITTKYGNRVFIRDKTKKTTNEYMNERIRQSVIRTKNNEELKIKKEKLQEAYNKRGYNGKETDMFVTDISPDNFLKITTTPEILREITDSSNRNHDFYIDYAKKEFMSLGIDMKTGKVEFHEGRHRMVALKEEGYKKAQIIIYATNGSVDPHNPKTYFSKTISHQRHDNDTTIVLNNIEPLNQEKINQLKK